jgi:hypothetical protein
MTNENRYPSPVHLQLLRQYLYFCTTSFCVTVDDKRKQIPVTCPPPATLAYVSICQHTSAYISINENRSPSPVHLQLLRQYLHFCTSFCVSICTFVPITESTQQVVHALERGRQHTSAYVSGVTAYVSIRQRNHREHTAGSPRSRASPGGENAESPASVSIRQHPSASVSIRQHISAYVSIRQHMSAYVSIRQHTSAYVSIRQHTQSRGSQHSRASPGGENAQSP